MPMIKVNDLDMYYEIHGEENETPLVLIMGLSGDILGWMFQLPELSKKYRVIAFDNRDAGRTSKTEISYTVDTCAEDTYHLLNKLGVEKAHILGASMGGMIAQTFAIMHPEMVRSLTLACTIPRGPIGLSNLTIWKELAKSKPKELFLKDMLVRTFTPETLQNEEFVKTSLKWYQEHPYPQPPEAFIRQCEAIEKFNVMERLKEINAPTLVIVGGRDILTPIWYSEEIASRIPNAELKVIPGCGHAFFLEKPDEFNKAVLEFLENH
ncbi:MAG: alpha/beta fold hydrolase [Candidatus Jordarchaeum sp.]|uniref:alpha/beta fold hydrolase n=1 Tax=Candidatus Jordarchaeum sp. TaxID=2823881 RepID=UPI00404B1BB0